MLQVKPITKRLLGRWLLWTIPISVLAGPLAVVLVVLFSTSDPVRLGKQLAQLVSWELLPGLMAAGLLFVPFFGVAILVWGALVRLNPALDRSWMALSLALPSAFLLASASYSLASEGARNMRLLSLPAPFLIGCLALIPRRLDPHLRLGAISSDEPVDAV